MLTLRPSSTPLVVQLMLNGVAPSAHLLLAPYVDALARDLKDLRDAEYRARDLVDRMALALQASLLLRHAPACVSDAFCGSRLASIGQHSYGALPVSCDVGAIIARATPRI
jgi:putative acyl-CoA dehydrogenase